MTGPDTAGARRPLATAETLPARFYTDRDLFLVERERIFAKEWISVGRVEDVEAPGDFLTFDVAGEPVVVVHGNDGALRAFPNVCRHRNTTIVEGSGNVKALQCPYHLWTYRLDGTLARAPGMQGTEGFDVGDVCLPALSVETWQGWVFVNLDPHAEPLAPRLAGLDEICAPYDLESMRRVGALDYPAAWNWKLIVENFSESYHHPGVHPSTLEPNFPGNRSWSVENVGQPWTSLDHVSLTEDLQPFTASLVFPSHAFSIARPDALVWFRMEIHDVTDVDLQLQVFFAPEIAGDADLAAMMLAGLRAINDEDTVMNRRTQRGLASRFATPGRISPLEGATWEFRRWVVDRVEPEAAGRDALS
jgi:phenylpropionate dioxygenase-like ring-hydroxylating dioxygenase large terminal subunit